VGWPLCLPPFPLLVTGTAGLGTSFFRAMGHTSKRIQSVVRSVPNTLVIRAGKSPLHAGSGRHEGGRQGLSCGLGAVTAQNLSGSTLASDLPGLGKLTTAPWEIAVLEQ
jgi:hypothetical protein